MKAFLGWMVLLASSVAAADLTGKWTGTAETPNGSIQRNFTFTQEGTKLTGETTSDFTGKSTIEDGKVDGDAVTFSIKANFQGTEATLKYKGKITGDEMTLDVEVPMPDAPQIRYVAKRVK